jgi:hypothetical protein
VNQPLLVQIILYNVPTFVDSTQPPFIYFFEALNYSYSFGLKPPTHAVRELAMAQPTHNLGEQMAQLEAARNLVLGDAALYSQIVQGILPIIGANARLELRRWGAEFLAETFASPALAAAQKEKLADTVLLTVREILEEPTEDTTVIKSMVQTAASLYTHVFRHM